jgi:hypothetical protein
MSAGLSNRAVARHLGVNEKAVRRGIQTGRLRDSVRDVGGRRVVVDLELARQEWQTNAGRPGLAADTADVRTAAPSSLLDVQKRVGEQRVRKLQLDNDIRSGQVISVDKVKREAFSSSRIIREAMLNLPARLAGELAAERDEAVVFRKLDTAIRAALNDAADALVSTVH